MFIQELASGIHKSVVTGVSGEPEQIGIAGDRKGMWL